jgi:hypothetical protein
MLAIVGLSKWRRVNILLPFSRQLDDRGLKAKTQRHAAGRLLAAQWGDKRDSGVKRRKW